MTQGDTSNDNGLIGALHQAYARGELTVQAVVDRCLDNVRAHDPGPTGLNAIVAINPDAPAQAKTMDAAGIHDARALPPLHGVPLIIKDNIHAAGMPTRGGAATLPAIPDREDSEVCRRLRAAGAIILAKSNLHELALAGTTASSSNGQTRNPYDPSRTPGGSSGGTGAALAAGFGLAGMGTDTVNSIRSPASANALVGLRPTRGRVSRAGVLPVCESQDVVGPLALTVADAARMLDVLSGFDPRDPATALGTTAAQVLPAARGGPATGLKGKRLGILRSLFGEGPDASVVNTVLSRWFDRMADAGAELVEIDAPDVDSERLLRELDVQRWEFRIGFDAWLAQHPEAGVADLDAFVKQGLFHPSLQVFLEGARAVRDPWADPEYLARRVKMVELRERLIFLMVSHGVEALLHPLQKCLVVPIGEADQRERTGIVAALSGLPAINIPVGFSPAGGQAPLGIPVGLDMLGRPFDERGLVQIALACESLGAQHKPPVGFEPLAALL
ncbi:MAG: amidase [Castellaniella sp.]